ncbi:hypothetical protein [Streptomyces sp. NPDC094149]|uniref:hypothetical protein n=1 Tax=Streptomyces sp. NPDC094149 TaxID=3155079 RepID=UPI00331C253E
MSQRLRFILDGDDHLSPVLNRAGDSSARLHRRLNDDMDGSSRAVRGFTQDADGRLRDLRGRFLSIADAQRMMAGGMPDLTRRVGDLGDTSSSTAASMGSSGGGLGGALIGVAAAAGLSLLPALGALVPMMAGAALAAGTLKLGFSGVADALAVAGDKKKFREQLKTMAPEARDFTKSLVSLKQEFSGFGKQIQKAMLPGFTKAVQAAGPVVKILGKSMTELGGAFGDAAEGVGRMLKDSGFQDALQTNLKLGTGFIRDMTGALGPFTRSLLDFGAASGPTLRSFSNGLSGLLSKGLPDMFTGLQRGIPGAAKMLDGLFSLVNDLLGGIGRLAGEMGRTLGPVFGETFRLLGDVASGAMDALAGELKILSPLFKDLTFGLKSIRDFGALVGPTLADTGNAIIGAFLPIGDSVNKAVGPLQRLDQAIKNNKIGILEGARVFGDAMIDLVSAGIQAAPKVIHIFSLMSIGVLSALSGIVHGAATAFGWVPGIGSKLKGADRAFKGFKDSYIAGLATAERAATSFANSTAPKLSAGKLKLNINNWQQQIDAAKAKLKTVPPSKQAALKATIRDLQNKIAQARHDLSSIDGSTATVRIMTQYFTAKNPAQLAAAHGRRTGGPAPKFAAGGMPSGLLSGPGTGTSDSIPMWWAGDGEYVVNARSTKKYRSLIEAINADNLGSGHGMPGAGAAVGQGLASGMAGSTAGVGAAARAMAAAVTAGIKEELQIASPSRKTRALAKDVGKGFISGLTGSRDKIKSVAKDLAKDIKTAFSGRKESSLLRMVDRQTKKLMDLAAKRDKIAAKIAEAKAYASDTTKTARSAAGLGNLGMGEGEVTAGGIKAGLAQKLAQIRQFSRYISILAKKGLNKGLLRQILDMGPVDGFAYASALVGADKNTFSAINASQKAIDKESTKLGKKGADALYDSGKNASKGFLAGLKSQQKGVEKLMLDIAKGMQAAIKKALGIKSPSTVMARLGAYSTHGLARGLVSGLPVLDRALDTVSGRVAATRPVIGRPAVAGAGGVMTVNISVTDARDPVATAKEIRRELLELKRVFGMNVELKVG